MRRRSNDSNRTRSRRRAAPALWALIPAAVAFGASPENPLPAPLYSFDLLSPSLEQNSFEADDILALNFPFPIPVITGAMLGLGAPNDELDALSAAHPLFPTNLSFALMFSVTRESVGAAPPAPALVALGIPYNVADQAARGHQAGDAFLSLRLFTLDGALRPPPAEDNGSLVRNNYDEGGTDFAARPETSAQSTVVNQPQDNVDAMSDVAAKFGPYFSAGAASPSLSSLPGSGSPSGAHVFFSNLLQTTLYASFAALGLQQGDDIDALVVFDRNADGTFNGPDYVLFSLTPDSPSLTQIPGASAVGAAADVFVVSLSSGKNPQPVVELFASAASLGLGAASDDIDALEVVPCTDGLLCATSFGIRRIMGDMDDDGDVDAEDLDIFDDCFRGEGQPYDPGCERGDFDNDSDIDCSDWLVFANAWTEPGSPPMPAACAHVIPAASTWTLVLLTGSLLAAAVVVLHRRKSEC